MSLRGMPSSARRGNLSSHNAIIPVRRYGESIFIISCRPSLACTNSEITPSAAAEWVQESKQTLLWLVYVPVHQ